MIWLVVLKAEKSEAMAVASGKKLLLYPMAARKAQKTETKKRVIAFTTSPLKATAHSHSGPSTSTWASNKSHILGWLIAQLVHGNLTGALKA